MKTSEFLYRSRDPQGQHKKRSPLALLVVMVCLVGIVPSAFAANTITSFVGIVPDSACPAETLNVCAQLVENCGGGNYAPLPNRPLLFFLNVGNCGVNQAQVPDDTVWTDANGIACSQLIMPVGKPGAYALRVKFLGEDKPGHGDPPNSACNTSRKVQLSASNVCKGIEIASGVCSYPPEANCPGDLAVTQCELVELCLTGFSAFDPDGDLDSVFVSLGLLSGDTVCFTPTGEGDFDIWFYASDSTGSWDSCLTTVSVTLNSDPTVSLPANASVFLCDPIEICLPVDIVDPDCDVVSVVSNLGLYSGTLSNFDQIKRLNQLGGWVTQVGGGAPGISLYTASDFVAPVNSQSGVSVVLPYFVYPSQVVEYGFFPSGTTPANSADHMLGGPTDLTFTAPGAGGPDGGDGDGSVSFAVGDYSTVDFLQNVTSCDGSASDLIIFTNTNGGGSATVTLRLGGTDVYTTSTTIPGGLAATSLGGVTLDLPDGITFDRIRVDCLSGTFEIDAFAARTAPTSTSSDICFDADTSGIYEIIVTATDACGNVGADTSLVTVTLNSAPVADAGDDFSVFQCDPTEICFGVSFYDIDLNLSLTEKVSGPGTLTGGQICFTPTASGNYTFIIRAVDSCGLEDSDTVVVSVLGNDPPVADDPASVTLFLCDPLELCHTFTATDPNGGTLTWTHIGGAGSITPEGLFCFTPSLSGTYGAAVVVTDSCGLADTTTIQYDITINTTPTLVDPGLPVDLFLCSVVEICYDFVATDPDGGVLVWSQISGDGALDANGHWCFTPVAAGTYTATVVISDSCGTADTVSHTYNVGLNEPPTIAFPADTVLELCDPGPWCTPYTVTDPQGLGGLVETMISGYGTIDTAANEICFTPTTDGNYQFIVGVTDSCGATAVDTINVQMVFGEYAVIDCPPNPIDVTMCAPGDVCQLLGITPASATVTTSVGTYGGGQLCFTADTSGVYEITVIADEECGSDTCTLVFNVEIGIAASINCPAPQSLFICAADSVCIPVGINGSDLVVTVGPVGTYQAGNVCIPADSSGHYIIHVVANSSCGVDSCDIIIDIDINSPPVADEPTSPVDTFVCSTGQICYDFNATDPNSGLLSWARLSGDGVVSSSGQWCFDVTGSGSYTVVVAVSDSCGAADTVSLTYNVTLNSAPVVDLGPDSSLFLCAAGLICLPYATSDLEDNITTIEILSGDPSGYIDEGQSWFCFIPSGDGVYEFVVLVTDACGAVGIDTLVITIDVNLPPIVSAGVDQTIFACSNDQICWPASITDPDGNLVSSELIEGPGTFDGSQICFTPTGTYNYEFILKGTDYCGLETVDTVAVYYTLNSAPSADAGNDQTLFLCDPTPICWSAACDDIDGNLLSCDLYAGPGTYDGSNICFTPTASGSYTFVLRAEDACGEIALDTAVIEVTINSAPVCTVPNDTAIFQCVAAEVCLPAFGTDIDGNLDFCQIISGPGSLLGGNWCYTPTSDQAVTVVVRCQDSCGAYCESEFTVEFDINGQPEIAFGNDFSLFLCDPLDTCLTYIAGDPDDPRPTTTSLVSGPGTLDEANSRVCFSANATGSYQFIVRIEDECGAFDEDTINVDVTINSMPVVDAGLNQDIFLCDPTSICWPVSFSDLDNDLVSVELIGPGTLTGSTACFTPTTAGEYQFILQAIDGCGVLVADTVTINVEINSPPTLAFGDDFAQSLCVPEQINLSYTVNDPDGLSDLTELLVSGFGTIDTAGNVVSFTPTTDGVYEFIARVTDSCGVFGQDTIVVTITFGETADIDCPTGPIDVFLCAAGDVCYLLNILPSGAAVTTSLGAFDGSQLCFWADTSGVYSATVIADAECGSDTCVIVFNVEIGVAAVIECPDPQSFFICEAGNVCFPITVITRGDTVTVEPIGYYDGGNVCFPADTSGHYELTVIASTSCGDDTCVAIIDVVINSAPTADDPDSPVDTFLCEAEQICYQFNATDVDGGPLTWSRVSGPGTVSASGLWCFTSTGQGTYTVVANVTDSCEATDEVTLTYEITLNSAPVVSLGTDQTLFMCDASEMCFPYTVSDIDSNVALVELIVGVGTIDAGTICFTPDTAGVYVFTLRATDSCDAAGEHTVAITIGLNNPPVADAGADQTLFQCDATEVCWDASCVDPDANLESCTLVSGFGTYDGSRICFLPDTAGLYTFVLRAQDVCGLIDDDTVLVSIALNGPPVCELPGDTSFFQCNATQISLAVGGSDPDGNFSHCEIVTGPGTIVGGNWVYTPSADLSASVKIMCLDSCGAMCEDSFTVSFELNTPPVVDIGPDTTYFLCNSQTICWPVVVDDEDGNMATVEVLSPIGAYLDNSDLCFTFPGGEAIYQFIVRATDSCGRVSLDTALVGIDFNQPPVLNLPPSFTAYLDAPGETCFDVGASDPDDNLVSVSVSPFGTYNPVSGQVCFVVDTSGVYCLVVTATDACNASVVDTVCLEIVIDECIHVQIEKTHNTIQGQHETVRIFHQGSGKELGGFNILIAYDATALTAGTATPGDAFVACGWEYFTFRQGADGNCNGGCPSGLMRIIAIAETNNGANHPGCFLDGVIGSLVDIDFLVSNDRNLECMYAPIRFFWLDCGDNSFSSRSGDTLWISRSIYDFELADMTDYSYGFPGYYGAPDTCLVGGGEGKPAAIRCVDFTNGGVDIVCADSIDDRGDLNLNGVSYEIADAVLYTNYFVYGLTVFDNIDAQTAASDVNADGITLSVADLVYLIRILVGDAPAYPKIDPSMAAEVEFSVVEGVLTIANSEHRIGAIFLTLDGQTEPSLHADASHMEMRFNYDGSETRVLIYNMKGKQFLETGNVLNVGNRKVKKVEVGAYDGYILKAVLGTLPESYALSQNFPNPFNPTTTIRFALPVASEWNLTIYNILGQQVQSFNGKADAGYHEKVWDAGRFASGVYFYRLRAGSFTATKKMVLLK